MNTHRSCTATAVLGAASTRRHNSPPHRICAHPRDLVSPHTRATPICTLGVLHRYAPGLTEGGYTTDFLANPRANAVRARFETAVPSNATLAVLAADSDLAFLLDNYHGDLLLGLAYALDIIAGFVQQLLTRKEAALICRYLYLHRYISMYE